MRLNRKQVKAFIIDQLEGLGIIGLLFGVSWIVGTILESL